MKNSELQNIITKTVNGPNREGGDKGKSLYTWSYRERSYPVWKVERTD